MLILSGPPVAGKNTIGTLRARQRDHCAVIDVDQVRAMIVQPHRAPRDGEEGWRQQRLGVLQTCRLATGFADGGWEVIILDVVSGRILPLYRQHLDQYPSLVVQLLSDWAERRRRFLARGPALPDDEFAMIYREQATFTGYALQIDNTALPASDVVAQLAPLL